MKIKINYCIRGHKYTDSNTSIRMDWRYGTPVRICITCHKAQHRIRVKRHYDKYKLDTTFKIKKALIHNNWVANNPEKYAAHTLVNNAVRSGKIAKPNNCDRCGVESRLHGHHKDYSKALEVMWLCPLCHKEVENA